VRLLLIDILLHQSQEEDEDNRSGSYPNNDGYNHDRTANISANCNVPVPHSYLRHHLVIETGDERVQLYVYLTELAHNYPSTSSNTSGKNT
jgi:hypothetical protein